MKQKAEKHSRKALTVLACFILLVVLAGILIPRWLEHPNEKAAKATLWKIHEAQNTYYERYGVYVTPEFLIESGFLDEFKDANLGSQSVSTRLIQNGYFFYATVSKDKWHVYALPGNPGKAGNRKFYINHKGEFRSGFCPKDDNRIEKFKEMEIPWW